MLVAHARKGRDIRSSCGGLHRTSTALRVVCDVLPDGPERPAQPAVGAPLCIEVETTPVRVERKSGCEACLPG